MFFCSLFIIISSIYIFIDFHQDTNPKKYYLNINNLFADNQTEGKNIHINKCNPKEAYQISKNATKLLAQIDQAYKCS